MSRIIIENRSSLDDATALAQVALVIRQGRISNEGKQYCYVTRLGGLMIYSALNKASDRFIVSDKNNLFFK